LHSILLSDQQREEIAWCKISAALAEMADADADAEASRMDGEDEDEEQVSESDDGFGFDDKGMEFLLDNHGDNIVTMYTHMREVIGES
jgi:hypothetical protein